MEKAKKSKWDLLQNLIILLLSLSAVGLLFTTQFYDVDTRSIRSLFSAQTSAAAQTSGLSGLSTPLRVAVTGEYGRWADLSLSTDDAEFSDLRTLLLEALGSAGRMSSCGTEMLLNALGSSEHYGSSVYYDFVDPLPMSVLTELVGASWSGDNINVRRILLCSAEDGVDLFLWDGGDDCRTGSTALPALSITRLVDGYQLGSAFFAFEPGGPYVHLDPFSLFSDDQTAPVTLIASNFTGDDGTLMSALSFNPHTYSRYPESSGAEVVVEGDRTLRIQPDSSISYQSSGGPLYVSSGTDAPTVEEAVTGAYRVLSGLLSAAPSDARLYLRSVQQTGGVFRLVFDYHAAGLPIRFADGSHAAEVTVDGGAITRLTLHLRQYTLSEQAGLLLPLAQALPIAQSYPGAELRVDYMDAGGTEVSAQWLAE